MSMPFRSTNCVNRDAGSGYEIEKRFRIERKRLCNRVEIG